MANMQKPHENDGISVKCPSVRNLYFLSACLILTTPVKKEKKYCYIYIKGLKSNGIYW